MIPVNRINDVYYVEDAQYNGMDILAIRPEVAKNGIQWEDASAYHKKVGVGFSGIEYENDPDPNEVTPIKITIQTKKGEKIVLWKLDLITFNDNVKRSVDPDDKLWFTSRFAVRDYLLGLHPEKLGG